MLLCPKGWYVFPFCFTIRSYCIVGFNSRWRNLREYVIGAEAQCTRPMGVNVSKPVDLSSCFWSATLSIGMICSWLVWRAGWHRMLFRHKPVGYLCPARSAQLLMWFLGCELKSRGKDVLLASSLSLSLFEPTVPVAVELTMTRACSSTSKCQISSLVHARRLARSSVFIHVRVVGLQVDLTPLSFDNGERGCASILCSRTLHEVANCRNANSLCFAVLSCAARTLVARLLCCRGLIERERENYICMYQSRLASRPKVLNLATAVDRVCVCYLLSSR